MTEKECVRWFYENTKLGDGVLPFIKRLNNEERLDRVGYFKSLIHSTKEEIEKWLSNNTTYKNIDTFVEKLGLLDANRQISELKMISSRKMSIEDLTTYLCKYTTMDYWMLENIMKNSQAAYDMVTFIAQKWYGLIIK